MQLTSLTLHGFKSFGDRVTIEFDKGVTGIVGPNGSGKSNIIDGLRWVTGGGRASQYRAGDKTDLIFHGADGKRSLSYAEVEVELLKGKERITVSRNLMRDGNSVLKLNGKNCRLTDIEEALSGTGLGRGALAIVGQGEVGQVLTADPEKLLNYVAEAADVARLSNRREQTQARLLDAQVNLQRLADIMLELEHFIEQLREEAELAERHTQLSREALHLRYTLSCQREDALEKEVKTLRLQDAELSDKLSHSRLERRTTEESWQASRRRATDLEKIYRDALTKAEAQKAEHRIALERLEAIKQQESSLTREATILQSEISYISGTQAPEKPIDDLEVLKAKLNNKEGYLEALAKTLANLEEQKNNLERTVKQLQAQQVSEQQAHFSYETSKSRLEQEMVQLSERLAQVRTKESNDLSSLLESTRSLEDTLQIESQKLEEFKEALGRSLQDQAKYHAEARALQKAAEQSRNAFEARRGYASGPKTALGSGIKGIIGSVADIIRVEDDYRQAIAGALGRRSEYIITDTAETAQEVINYVKKAGGWVTTLPLDLVKGRATQLDSAVETFPGVLGLASDFVQVERPYLELIYQLLGSTALIESMTDATKLAKLYKQRPRLVSLDGSIMESYGAMSGGQSRTNVSVLGAAKDVEDAELEARAASQVAEAQKVAVETLQEQSRQQFALVQNLKQEVSANAQNLKEKQQASKVEESLIEEVSRQLEQKQNELEKLVKPALSNISSDLGKFEAELIALLEAHRQKSAEKGDIQSEQRDIQELLTLALERQKIYELAQQSFEINLNRLDDLKNKLSALSLNQASLKQGVEEAKFAVTQAEANLPKDLIEHQNVYAAALSAAQALEQKLGEFTELQAEIAEALESIKITLARREAALEIAVEERSAFPLGLERIDMSPRSCRERLNLIENELEGIGPVNHRAAQDLQGQKERYEDVQVQSIQATLAVTELEAILIRIDQDVTTKLRHAVEQLKVQFQHYVKELFGLDAKSNIIVHEEQDRPKGLSIILQPPGKQTQSLNLLSVGERTMGAMAFLFSLLQGQDNKRLPVAILDEVDAPLDEANIRRYCTFLDHLAKQGTQFVLITHQKATFDVANVLWGISSEKGVSRVFSISRQEYDVA